MTRSVRLGLISDTHMPARWLRLHDSIFDIFKDVDLILHAGDLGELWVLDELSKIAPVIAVHGNDETDAAQQALPYVQTLALAGHRLVLTHSHHPNRASEMELRKEDRWQPKFDRLADFATPHDADILVYGHTHIPMALVHNGVWLVNPGALASGALYMRQKIQTVVLMTLTPQKSPEIMHIDLNTLEPHTLLPDWNAGFKAAAAHYYEPIVTSELLGEIGWLIKQVDLTNHYEALAAPIMPMAHDCWSHQRDLITTAEFVQALANAQDLPPVVIEKLHESAVFRRYL